MVATSVLFWIFVAPEVKNAAIAAFLDERKAMALRGLYSLEIA